jgi:acyl-CoA synthetase (AMP-forming)/AMP-acid ligase II
MPMRSVVAAVLAHAEARPDAVALVEAQREISYATLARDIESTAARLHASGIIAGETIALDLKGSLVDAYERVCAFYALIYLGVAVLPLSSLASPQRRAQLLRDFDARLLEFAPRENAAADAKPARADDPGRLSMYRFSTGTTGDPKAVIVTNLQWVAHQDVCVRALDFDSRDRLLPPIPLPDPIGLRYMVRVHCAGGALVNVQLPRSLPALAQTIQRHGVTRVAASPAQLRWLVSRPLPPQFRMPALRGVVTGGAPLLPSEQDAVRQLVTPNLYIDYGALDFSMIAVLRPGDPPDAGAALIPGVDAEVVDEHDRALPFGAEGVLRVRAPWAPKGYADRASADRFRDGWFYPGDLAILGPDRRLKLIGRSDDLINRGGIKIVPEAIEAVLMTHPEVTDAAVVGVADRIAGEVPAAFVVLRSAAALDTLHAFCAEQMHEMRVPVGFVALAEIPRSPEGKVLRAQLRTLVRAR